MCIYLLAFGTEALINHFHNPISASIADVALVVSDSSNSYGIVKAKEHNIPTKVGFHCTFIYYYYF